MKKKINHKYRNVWIAAVLIPENEKIESGTRVYGVYTKKIEAKRCAEYYYQKICDKYKIHILMRHAIIPLIYKAPFDKLVKNKGYALTWVNER